MKNSFKKAGAGLLAAMSILASSAFSGGVRANPLEAKEIFSKIVTYHSDSSVISTTGRKYEAVEMIFTEHLSPYMVKCIVLIVNKWYCSQDYKHEFSLDINPKRILLKVYVPDTMGYRNYSLKEYFDDLKYTILKHLAKTATAASSSSVPSVPVVTASSSVPSVPVATASSSVPSVPVATASSSSVPSVPVATASSSSAPSSASTADRCCGTFPIVSGSNAKPYESDFSSFFSTCPLFNTKKTK